jgi:hypothetical protein
MSALYTLTIAGAAALSVIWLQQATSASSSNSNGEWYFDSAGSRAASGHPV